MGYFGSGVTQISLNVVSKVPLQSDVFIIHADVEGRVDEMA